MRPLTFLLLLLPLGLSAQTDAPAPARWQLDIVIFDRPGTHRDADSAWRFDAVAWPSADPRLIRPAAAMNAGDAIAVLNTSQSRLGPATSRLNAQGRYRVQAHYSLQLPKRQATPRLGISSGPPLRLTPRDTSDQFSNSMDYWLSAPDLDPPAYLDSLSGWLRFTHQIHPVVEFDISFVTPLVGVFPMTTEPDGRQEYWRDQVRQYRIQGMRRLYPGKAAYFDHPHVGVLALLSQVSADP